MTRMVQVNIGMRNMVMPGARILKIVTRKFSPPPVAATPRMMTPTSQRSMPTPAGCALPAVLLEMGG